MFRPTWRLGRVSWRPRFLRARYSFAMSRIIGWFIGRSPAAKIPGLAAWLREPRGAAPVDIGRARGVKLLVLLVLVGWVAPTGSGSGPETLLEQPVACTIGALVGVALWALLRWVVTQPLRLDAQGLSLGSGAAQLVVPWSRFDPLRRPLLVSGVLMSLPLLLLAGDERKVTRAAVLGQRELAVWLLQAVRPDDLVLAISAGVARFGALRGGLQPELDREGEHRYATDQVGARL